MKARKSKVGFEFLMARMQMAALWVVTLCSLAEVYRHSRECLHRLLIALMMEATGSSETSVKFNEIVQLSIAGPDSWPRLKPCTSLM
jgi:hypothetical protein